MVKCKNQRVTLVVYKEDLTSIVWETDTVEQTENQIELQRFLRC